MGATRWLIGVVVATGTLAGQPPPKLTPRLAAHAVGQVVTVCGDVGGLECRAGEVRALVLRTPSAGPGFEFAVDELEAELSAEPSGDSYFGQRVCATGTVVAMPDGHSIRVTEPGQLQIDEPNAEAAAVASGVSWCPSPIQLPRVVREVKPQYTYGSMKAGVEGTVTVTAIVGADGRVHDARVKRSLTPEMDESALKAVRQWQFRPGTKVGDETHVPVAVWIDLTFTLRK